MLGSGQKLMIKTETRHFLPIPLPSTNTVQNIPVTCAVSGICLPQPPAAPWPPLQLSVPLEGSTGIPRSWGRAGNVAASQRTHFHGPELGTCSLGCVQRVSNSPSSVKPPFPLTHSATPLSSCFSLRIWGFGSVSEVLGSSCSIPSGVPGGELPRGCGAFHSPGSAI